MWIKGQSAWDTRCFSPASNHPADGSTLREQRRSRPAVACARAAAGVRKRKGAKLCVLRGRRRGGGTCLMGVVSAEFDLSESSKGRAVYVSAGLS